MSTPASSTTIRSEGPHRKIEAFDARERFALQLFDMLWDRYRSRVEHVRTYERVVEAAHATFVNDHVAFRTFACQQPFAGIASISRIFEALGYQAAGCYRFPDKHLSAVHFQHRHPEFPKVFISELQTWELEASVRTLVERTIADHRPPLEAEVLERLFRLEDASGEEEEKLLARVVREFHELPWSPPEKADVEAANAASQYAAWVLVHGYCVNHFTCLVNSHGVPALDNIEKTVAALEHAGVPMKESIEGERGSKLRQSATAAAVIDVAMRDKGRAVQVPWTYAYFELAERGVITDPETGREVRFQGFLGPQATQLFEMTRVSR